MSELTTEYIDTFHRAFLGRQRDSFIAGCRPVREHPILRSHPEAMNRRPERIVPEGSDGWSSMVGHSNRFSLRSQ